jgi:hypothetical protein
MRRSVRTHRSIARDCGLKAPPLSKSRTSPRRSLSSGAAATPASTFPPGSPGPTCSVFGDGQRADHPLQLPTPRSTPIAGIRRAQSVRKVRGRTLLCARTVGAHFVCAGPAHPPGASRRFPSLPVAPSPRRAWHRRRRSCRTPRAPRAPRSSSRRSCRTPRAPRAPRSSSWRATSASRRSFTSSWPGPATSRSSSGTWRPSRPRGCSGAAPSAGRPGAAPALRRPSPLQSHRAKRPSRQPQRRKTAVRRHGPSCWAPGWSRSSRSSARRKRGNWARGACGRRAAPVA